MFKLAEGEESAVYSVLMLNIYIMLELRIKIKHNNKISISVPYTAFNACTILTL